MLILSPWSTVGDFPCRCGEKRFCSWRRSPVQARQGADTLVRLACVWSCARTGGVAKMGVPVEFLLWSDSLLKSSLKASRLLIITCLRGLSLPLASILVNSDLPMMVDWRWCAMEKIGMQGFRLSTCLNVVSIFSPSVVTVLSPIVNFLSLGVFFSFLIYRSSHWLSLFNNRWRWSW